MKVFNKIAASSMIAGLMVSGASMAAEIAPVKKTAIQQMSDGFYGNAETRLQLIESRDDSGATQRNRKLHLRPKIGTKLMSEKLDVNLTQPISNEQNSARTTRPRAELESTLTLFTNDNIKFEIYSFNFLANNETAYEGFLYLDTTAKYNIQTPVGLLETSMLLEVGTQLSNQEKKGEIERVRTVDGLALASSEAKPANAKENNKEVALSPLLVFKPTAVEGLSVALRGIFTNEYIPSYVQTLGDGTSSTKESGYGLDRSTQMRYTLTYKVNDTLSMYNQTRQNFGGYLEAVENGKAHLDNRTGVTVNLF
jgi:hypothetical protein